MYKITPKRIGEIIRVVLELLWNKPDGLLANEIIAFVPQMIHLTDHEKEYVVKSNMPRYERYIRLATIPLSHAGWLLKSKKGRWRLTEVGKQACISYPSSEDFYEAAVRRLEDVRELKPKRIAEAEKAEETAWEQIQAFISGLNQLEFSQLAVDLLESMGYHVIWSAQADSEISFIFNKDPFGQGTNKIFVQIQHGVKPVTINKLREFSALLGGTAHGVIISTAGYEYEVQKTAHERVYLVDMEMFFDLWIKHHSKHSIDAQRRFPLRVVYFLANQVK